MDKVFGEPGVVERVMRAVFAATEEENTTRLAMLTRAELSQRAVGGDAECTAALARFELEGMRREVVKFLKFQRQSVCIAYGGAVLSLNIPARVGVHPRNEETGKRERFIQQRLWIDLPWDDFVAHLGGLRAQAHELGLRVAIFDTVLALRALHPATATPRETMRAAGLDPLELNLADIAV